MTFSIGYHYNTNVTCQSYISHRLRVMLNITITENIGKLKIKIFI